MEKAKRIITAIKVVCNILIWSFAVCAVLWVFDAESEPVYERENINDTLVQATLLHPQDVLCQTFQIRTDNLESMALAFGYDDATIERGTLVVRFYHKGKIVVEQPLPFMAYPQRTFIDFKLGLYECMEDDLTVEVENTSEDEDCVLSLLSTTNHFA